MAEILSTIKELTLTEAFAVVGIGPETIDPTAVLSTFKTTWSLSHSDRKNIISAKNVVMQHLVSQQMKKKRYFEVLSPFDKTCPSCKGTGEIYKFTKKPVDVNCYICGGKGNLVEECHVCKGSGRHITRWVKGGGADLKCTKCDGKKTIHIKCLNCNDGKIRKIVVEYPIKSTTPCKYCNELGFIVPKLPKPKEKYVTRKIGTPVMTKEMASALSNMIKK